VVDRLVEYIQTQGWGKIAFMSVSTGYGDGGRAEFMQAAKAAGLAVVADERFGAQDTDMSAQLTKIQGSGADAILVWSIPPSAALVNKNAFELGMEIPILQSHGIGNQAFIDIATSEAAEGTVFPAGKLLVAEQLPDSDPQKAVLLQYKSDYEGQFGQTPSTFGGHAWDGIWMAVKAMEQAGPDRAGIRDQLEQIKDFVGITGVFNLSPSDHMGLTKNALALIRIENGEWKLAQAAKAATEQGEPYKIGVIVAETGPASSLGVPEANTVKMLEEQINAKGGVTGPDGKQHPLKVIVYDTESDETKTVLATKRLIEEDQVPVIVGPTQSGTSMAIIDTVQQAEVPLISLAASVQIIEPVAERKWVFKTPQTDRLVVDRLVEYIQTQGWGKIAFMSVSTGYGDGGRAEFMQAAKAAGLAVVADERFGAQDTDMSAQLTKIQGSGADAILVWSIPPSAALVNKNAFELGMEIPILQSHGIGNQAFIDIATSEAAEGTVFPAGKLLVAEQLPDSDPQKAVLLQYKSDYEGQFGQTPSTFGGHAWDGIWMAVRAMEQAGPDRAGIRDQLEQIKDFVGITGVFNLSPSDHMGLTKDALALIRIENGEWVPVK
ncbi:MAG TPA: hypothetical protein DEP84_10135, partial [Chloroflexi bacterium]|nr:hypothetical protein [Chloroflexota bacterium]